MTETKTMTEEEEERLESALYDSKHKEALLGSLQKGHDMLLTTEKYEEKEDLIRQIKTWKTDILVDIKKLEAITDEDEADEFTDQLREQALSVEVRSDWVEPRERDFEAGEYKILLAYGGPSIEITGELGLYGEATTAEFIGRWWGCKHAEHIPSYEIEAVLKYVNLFALGVQ